MRYPWELNYFQMAALPIPEWFQPDWNSWLVSAREVLLTIEQFVLQLGIGAADWFLVGTTTPKGYLGWLNVAAKTWTVATFGRHFWLFVSGCGLERLSTSGRCSDNQLGVSPPPPPLHLPELLSLSRSQPRTKGQNCRP